MHPASLPFLYRLHRTQWWSADALEQLQWRQLRRLLRHAYDRVPYYRRLFDSAGLTPDDVRGLEDLSLIPITTRDALQQAPLPDLLARGVDPARCVERRTRGTTGSPLAVYLSSRQKEAQDMVQARALLANGLKLRDRRAVFVAPWQIPQRPYAFQRLGIWRKVYFSIFEGVREQLQRLEQIEPDSIYGTPAILRALALEKLDGGSARLAPRTIFSTADLLDGPTRKLIETSFGVPAVDLYGSLELGYLAWQCPEERSHHLNVESTVMELLREGRPAPSGVTGEVVCTSLHAYAMPLIRYQLGDLVAASGDRCPCGRGLPLIELIEGRSNDAFLLPGRVVTPQALTEALLAVGGAIRQFRLVQHDATHVELSIVKQSGYTERTQAEIERSLSQLLGHDVAVAIHEVASIAPNPSGKRAAIISHVSDR